jgi:hypothetical protein
MGTDGGGIDPAVEVATSGITDTDIEIASSVELSMVIAAASTLGSVTLGTASGVTGDAGKSTR